ncbi:MAG: T9SS type A sorting domain-containing protein, partial [Bacteroidota bacterium]|nr:T9SS type A sorting domain-containing protein [Bacteroidota bacterium]
TITVNFSTKGGNVTVTAANTCGTSSAQTLAVAIGSCTNHASIVETENVPAQVITSDRAIQAYPNPTKGFVTLYVANMPSGNYQLSIYDAFGRVVLKGKIMVQQDHTSLDLSKYAKGFYTIQLSDGLKNTAFKVLVQ